MAELAWISSWITVNLLTLNYSKTHDDLVLVHLLLRPAVVKH